MPGGISEQEYWTGLMNVPLDTFWVISETVSPNKLNNEHRQAIGLRAGGEIMRLIMTSQELHVTCIPCLIA